MQQSLMRFTISFMRFTNTVTSWLGWPLLKIWHKNDHRYSLLSPIFPFECLSLKTNMIYHVYLTVYISTGGVGTVQPSRVRRSFWYCLCCSIFDFSTLFVFPLGIFVLLLFIHVYVMYTECISSLLYPRPVLTI